MKYARLNTKEENAFLMSMGRNICKIRKRAGMTQSQMYTRTEICQSLISDFENGRRVPNILHLRKIAEALNCELTDFL